MIAENTIVGLPLPILPAAAAEIAISVRGVSKMYRIYDRPQDRLKQMLLRGRRMYGREFWALRDVSFEVARGETLGIIGRNGSGKSTLLQIIASTLAPSTGEVSVGGRVAALLELGSGFNPEFTGRENVFLNGSILGFSRAEMAQRFDEIVAFADIGEFIDQPVKTYSSGMAVRLAFAVQAHVQTDVLIIDEALSVGDIFFQQKCFNHIRRLQERGVTILYVSHDLTSVQSICDRAILMKDGAAIFQGNPNEAVNRYYSALGEPSNAVFAGPSIDDQPVERTISHFSVEDIVQHTILRPNGARYGSHGLEVVAVRVCDDAGHDTMAVPMLGALSFYVLIKANQHVYAPTVGMHLYDRLSNLVFATGTSQLRHMLPQLNTGEFLLVRLRLELRVYPGEYTFNVVAGEPAASDNPNIGFVHDAHDILGPLMVYVPENMLMPFYGIVQLPMTVEHGLERRA